MKIVGKRSGAYSAGALVHPFVLLNYTGTLDSQFTLAHEMGHALHSYLSNHTQPTIYQDYVIFVAEVASTCNEALLMQHLLKQTTDKRQRAYLINYFLEQFRTTLYRQTMFAEFELRIAELSRAGQTLTADLLCEEYRKLNEAYYGPDVVLDENIALEWARSLIFITITMCSSTQRAILRPSRSRSASSPRVSRQCAITSASSPADAVRPRSSCCAVRASI